MTELKKKRNGFLKQMEFGKGRPKGFNRKNLSPKAIDLLSSHLSKKSSMDYVNSFDDFPDKQEIEQSMGIHYDRRMIE